VVQLAVFASQAEDEGGSSQIASQSDDNAVRGTLPFDLYPPALARQITTVGTLGNHPLEARDERQPLLRLMTLGAQFAQVAVDSEMGLVRVRRMLGFLRTRTRAEPEARAQPVDGGRLWELGQALLEGNQKETTGRTYVERIRDG
jgi:CO/xanthine dehydrogenase Mo-binding subunit